MVTRVNWRIVVQWICVNCGAVDACELGGLRCANTCGMLECDVLTMRNLEDFDPLNWGL